MTKQIDKGQLREAIKYYRSKPIGKVHKSTEPFLKAVTEGLVVKLAPMLQELHGDALDNNEKSYFIEAKYLLNRDGYGMFGKHLVELGYGKSYDLTKNGIRIYI